MQASSVFSLCPRLSAASFCYIYFSFCCFVFIHCCLHVRALKSLFPSLDLLLNPSLPPVPPLLNHPPTSLFYPLRLMERITGLLKIATLQSQFIFFFLSFSLFPFLMFLFFPLFLTSLRREMSNGEKACQLIYQVAAHV